MDRKTILYYIDNTPNIEFVSSLVPERLGKEELPLFLLECKLSVGGISVPIKLWVTKWFPQKLPLFFLEKYDTLGFLPHIEPQGSICYLEKESVYTNIEEPEAVFQASVELAIQTLADGLNGNNQKDFREEFHVFWESNQFLSKWLVMSFIDIADEPKRIQLLQSQQKAIVFDLDKDIEIQKRLHFKRKNPTPKSGIYIPLKSDCEIIPPKFDQKWSINELVNWLKPQIQKEHWETIVNTILNKKPKRFEYLLLGIPRATGTKLLVGVQLKPKESTKHPLLDNDTNWGLNLIKVNRLDSEAFLPRGGAKIELQKKSVLLVGCGSVGSHLAIDLAKMGIGAVELVDDDKIELENLQRYAIGFEYFGKQKVEAIKEYLNKNFLRTIASSFNGTLEKFLENQTRDINKYDLVISATGDPAINLQLNKLTKESSIPFIVGWNEPLGIGGHALLSVPGKQGCYRCLYRDRYNFASFAAKEQVKPFYKKHLGCGEVYTPYSALDSIRTGELISRLAISFLSGKSDHSEFLSWKGEKEEFENEGFNLSTRYTMQSQEEMNKNRFSYIQDHCPHCKHLK